MTSELKRRRPRFVQESIGIGRAEGVGRSEAHRDDSLNRDLGVDRPDHPAADADPEHGDLLEDR